jgi:hypothetical protein
VEEARLFYALFFGKRNNILVGRIFGNLILCASVCVCTTSCCFFRLL